MYIIVNALHKGNNNIIIIKSLYLIPHLSSATEPASLSGRVAALYQCKQGSGPAHMVARCAVFVLPVVYAYLPRSAMRCFVTCLTALSLYYWLSEIPCAPVQESCWTVMGVGKSCALFRLCPTSDKSPWYPFVHCGCYSNPYRTCDKLQETFCSTYISGVDRDGSVGVATRYGLDSPGNESHWGARFSASNRTGPGAHPPPIQWVPSHFRG